MDNSILAGNACYHGLATGTLYTCIRRAALREAIVAANDDLAALDNDELLAAYVENIRAWEETEHIGAKNRLMDRRLKIVGILQDRSQGMLQPLRALLEHPDPTSATVSRSSFERSITLLLKKRWLNLPNATTILGGTHSIHLDWMRIFKK
jgi:hypothetical protein